MARSLQRDGHPLGDDFALYLRQARSLFNGDIAQVVSDNRFTVLGTPESFTPIAYPWIWPIVLSPFVWLWGLDYERLKLIQIGVFCLWLLFMFFIVRRRLGFGLALAFVGVFATGTVYLTFAGQLLSEYSFFLSVAVVIWWLDRIAVRAGLLMAGLTDIALLGVIVAVAFNVRREALAILPAIALMQAIALARRGGWGMSRLDTRRLLAPYAGFVGTAVLFQLLLPTALLPDRLVDEGGNSGGSIPERLSEYPETLIKQLGVGAEGLLGRLMGDSWTTGATLLGVCVLLLALIGAILGVRARPMLDLPIALIAGLTALAISTHPREVERYWLQITPWVVYFVTVAFIELGRSARVRRLSPVQLGLIPLLALIAVHTVLLPGRVADVRAANAAGPMWGPSHPGMIPVFDAVKGSTGVGDVVAFFRPRMMTLITDRRSVRGEDVGRLERNADFFAQLQADATGQPEPSREEAQQRGWEEVWSDERWVLWRIPEANSGG